MKIDELLRASDGALARIFSRLTADVASRAALPERDRRLAVLSAWMSCAIII